MVKCPNCGALMKMESENLAGGYTLQCENCGLEGWAYYDADGSLSCHFDSEDTDYCEICDQPIEDEAHHVFDHVVHPDCVSRILGVWLERRRMCIDCLVEHSSHLDVGHVIEVVPEDECEYFTAKD